MTPHKRRSPGISVMKIGVVGTGRWGTFLAYYFRKIGHEVALYGRGSSRSYIELCERNGNSYIENIGDVRLTDRLDTMARDAELVVISVGSQALAGFLNEYREIPNACKNLLLAMKGIEVSSGRRLSVVCKEEFPALQNAAVLVGPGHVESFVKGIPSCMLISSGCEEYSMRLAAALSSPLIRLYYSEDLIGCEIGAAAKNVIGIAAGMLDGLNMSGLKGALMARGTKEVSRLIEQYGGRGETVYGLSHLGDYEATLFSPYSNNRMFGENWIHGVKSDKLAEGYYSVKAMYEFAQKTGIDAPIIEGLYRVIYMNSDVEKEIDGLFARDMRKE